MSCCGGSRSSGTCGCSQPVPVRPNCCGSPCCSPAPKMTLCQPDPPKRCAAPMKPCAPKCPSFPTFPKVCCPAPCLPDPCVKPNRKCFIPPCCAEVQTFAAPCPAPPCCPSNPCAQDSRPGCSNPSMIVRPIRSNCCPPPAPKSNQQCPIPCCKPLAPCCVIMKPCRPCDSSPNFAPSSNCGIGCPRPDPRCCPKPTVVTFKCPTMQYPLQRENQSSCCPKPCPPKNENMCFVQVRPMPPQCNKGCN